MSILSIITLHFSKRAEVTWTNAARQILTEQCNQKTASEEELLSYEKQLRAVNDNAPTPREARRESILDNWQNAFGLIDDAEYIEEVEAAACPLTHPKPVSVPKPITVPTPAPVKVIPEPVRPAPQPVTVPTPEPVKVIPEPIKPAPEPVKVIPEPVKVAPEPVKATPSVKKSVPAPKPVKPSGDDLDKAFEDYRGN
jgi:hypothetical protein